MYAAKEAGKNCYVHFQPEMLAALLERTQLTSGLRRAVELGQITVHYQPVISTDRLEVVQFEALARWEWDGELMSAGRVHPDRRTQRPDPRHRRRGAAAQLHRAAARGWPRIPSGASPSTSPACSCSTGTSPNASWTLRPGAGVDPHQLVLEVTESVFFDADSHVIGQLEQPARRRHPGGAGRLRDRLLLAGPAAGPAGGRGQDRQVLRVHAAHRGGEAPDPDLHDPHGPQPGPEGHGRGHRDPGPGPVPAWNTAATPCRATSSPGRCPNASGKMRCGSRWRPSPHWTAS